jgi:hypothetical protein
MIVKLLITQLCETPKNPIKTKNVAGAFIIYNITINLNYII